MLASFSALKQNVNKEIASLENRLFEKPLSKEEEISLRQRLKLLLKVNRDFLIIGDRINQITVKHNKAKAKMKLRRLGGGVIQMKSSKSLSDPVDPVSV